MRKYLAIAACVFVMAVTGVLCWPTGNYDITKVHPKLSSLSMPCRYVASYYYLDGGSLGIRIVDGNDRVVEMTLPVSSDGIEKYPRLFLGATYIDKPGAVEVDFTEDTRRMLCEILENSRDCGVALIALRGLPKDYAHLIWRNALRVAAESWKEVLHKIRFW